MSNVQLGDVELRLLRVLEALLDTGSVTRAAAILGITASAVSHSLRELRVRFDDPLLVRVGSSMKPTPRALAIEPTLRQGLSDLRRVLTLEERFDPAVSVRSFSLATPGSALFTRLPDLIARLKREAPGIDFRLLALHQGLSQALADGHLDILLSGGGSEQVLGLDQGLMRSRIYSEPFCCIVRAGHPLGNAGSLDLAAYAAAEHVLSTTGVDRGIDDEALAQHGLSRRVALIVPSFAAALGFVAASDMMALVPETIALAGEYRGLVSILTPPFDLPRSDAYLWWHPRYQNDAAHSWWRSTITQAFATKSRSGGALY